jgi:hypothetical protein
MSGFVSHERVEHPPHRFRVAVHDRRRCLDVPVGVEVLPVKREPRVAGELLEEGPLGPPVALTERANRVDLAQVEGQTLLRRTPVTGSVYGSSGTYGCRYRATVLRYSSAALTSPST